MRSAHGDVGSDFISNTSLQWVSPMNSRFRRGLAFPGDFLFLCLLATSLFVLSCPSSVSAAVPGAPAIGPTSAGSRQVTVNFTPPLSDGGSPILDYTATSNPGNLTATGSASPLTITGLTNGTVYTFTVKARNSDGYGPSSGASFNTTPRLYAPATGTINNLVVFIRFSDQPEFTRPLSYYNGLFNTASNSLKNYYLENSYNTLTVNSSFYPASSGGVTSYRDSYPTSYYQPFNAATNPGGYLTGADGTARETALVNNALNAVSADIAADGLDLDGDNDGYIDHITFEVYSTDLNQLPVKFYSRATYDTSGSIVMNGKQVGSYTWVTASQDHPASYLAATEIHEMGHSFGYPDLRHNSGRTPVGDWDVMSMSKPVHAGAYMKYKFTHWISDIPEIDAYGSYALNDITQATNNSYKITIPGKSEFLVLEYRRAMPPFESNLPGSGLCITRINEAAGVWGNLGGPPFFLYYYRPGGTYLSDGSSTNSFACLNAETGRIQFNDFSTPPCFLSDGSPCGISIDAIGSAAGPSITFSVSDPNTTIVTRLISGYVYNGGNRVSGVTVNLSGDATASTTTDSLGRYLFTVTEGGNYIITPSKVNLTFTPVAMPFNNVASDQIQNFAAANNTNTISGNVTSGGIPLSGVTVTCSKGSCPAPVITDATGAYMFVVNAGGDYDVSAAKTNYFFSPYKTTFNNITTDQVQNFTTWTSTVNLTGTISHNGGPLSGVAVSCPGANTTTPTVTNGTGAYSFNVTVGNGSGYEITPSSPLYTFSPPSRIYNGLVSSQVQDFTAILTEYVLVITRSGSGTVLADNNPLPWTGVISNTTYSGGVTVNLGAAPDQCFSFGGWGGDYQSNDKSATLPMSQNWDITVTFRPNLPAYNATAKLDYATLDALSQAVADGDSIFLQEAVFNEALLVDKNALTVTGGVDCDFQPQDAATTIKQFVIEHGSVLVSRIVVQ